MAFATEITIGTSSKMSANFQSQDFAVSLTYQLERDDVDLVQIAEEKATEVETLHTVIRRQILQLRTEPTLIVTSDRKPQDASNPAETNGSAPMQATVMEPETRREPTITETQKRVTAKLVERAALTDDELQKLIACRFGRNAVGELTQRQGRMLIADLQRRIQRLQSNTGSDATA